ncbi:hypothetical protein [Gracilimonas mengyeensis]|uniref:Metallo-peptidase family M12B Reprolysin-like n=1 Tax=Gracilimonas mengyeensis TaxID=1302730 RepID=A0A521E1F7_9BACT|nr:hypothetical protein [Gracilimonas mengyeensis]SMO77768.1 hypothetical protein SAMN06265219_11062 [Gracilimonas mengyeensis]
MEKRVIVIVMLFGVITLIGCSSNSKSDPYSSTNPPGTSAGHYLRADEFDRLIVEIDYVTGNKPSAANIEVMQSFLEYALAKPKGIEIILDDEIDSLTDFYGRNEMAIAENRHRDMFTEGKTLATYVLYMNGKVAASSIGGSTFYNTSMAVFPEFLTTIADTVSAYTADELISYVTVHEFGHKLGLVDIGSPMQEPHAFRNARGHCSDSTCVMWPTITEASFERYKSDTTFGLGSLCLQDLLENAKPLN